MKLHVLALAMTCGVASCSASESPTRNEIPAFVKADANALALSQEPTDDVYVVNAFFDAGSGTQNPDIGPAIVTLDSPMIYIASFDDVTAGSLQFTPQGWTMSEPLPQCRVNCAAGKQRLLAMLHTKAKITINQDGLLEIRAPDGSRATGAPAPMGITD